ncbi:lactadherin-like [Patiria miniata]|uniref:F5/8 type C domain-containing protein n=1 Tax=Patiria miniata TaxID=46514 RepID=A0A913ZQY6_PATMI|nr:lactadherin-like [Patiria miniata]
MDGAVFPLMLMSALIVMVSCHPVCLIGSEYSPQSGTPPRWFLPYKDPCQCTAVRLGGMQIPASSYRQGAPYYLDELFLGEDSDEIQAYFNCALTGNNTGEKYDSTTGCSSPRPLGMEDGTIPDDRITASSCFNSAYFPASAARLNNNNRWLSAYGDTNPWVEVDLVQSTVLSGVITQGSGYGSYIKQYKVAYKKQPSSDYEHLKDANGNIKVFIGNNDTYTPVTNLFGESVEATVVRIEPTDKNGILFALRLEVLGCRRD